jgi:hypothetical protein
MEFVYQPFIYGLGLFNDSLQFLFYEAKLFLQRNQLSIVIETCWGFKFVQRSLGFTVLIGFTVIFSRTGICLIVSLGEGRFGWITLGLLSALSFREAFIEETKTLIG